MTIPTLRQQTGIQLWLLNTPFHLATRNIWNEMGIDAARCFALGA